MTCYAIIAGGGTSGHVLPALAVAESILETGHSRDEVVYFGTLRGIETKLVPPTGLSLHLFDVNGLKREFSTSACWNNLLFAPKLIRSSWQAWKLLKHLRPRVVVSVGGYASLPAVIGARVLRIPVVVITYDRTPGRSSAITSRFAAAVASAFPDSPLPRSQFTGAPVRREIRTLVRREDRVAARERLGIDSERFCVGVIGGSLGSGVLNAAIQDFAKERMNDRGLAIRHVVGERFIDSYRDSLMAAGVPFVKVDEKAVPTRPEHVESGLQYQIIGYEEDMASMYAAVDVIVGRGGAGTVAEVAVTGTPAVLIPWAQAADDHQTANVRWLADNGGAVFLSEDSCRQELSNVLTSLQQVPESREQLGQQAYALGEKNRVGAIAALIESVALPQVAP